MTACHFFQPPILIGIAGGGLDDLLERHIGEWRTEDELIERINVALVMFAVVDAQRGGRNERLESVFRIGERRQRMRGGTVERIVDRPRIESLAHLAGGGTIFLRLESAFHR